MLTTRDAPAASVTWLAANALTKAAGPDSDRLNVSLAVPVFVTVKENVVPGGPAAGDSVTSAPCDSTFNTPSVKSETNESEVETASTWNGYALGKIGSRGQRERDIEKVASAGRHVDAGLLEAGINTGRQSGGR